MQERAIIWDWNGTLLDDVDICLTAVNEMLAGRGHPPLSVARYKAIFRFPVVDYYREAGFDLVQEDFEGLAQQFIRRYLDLLPRAPLTPQARLVLEGLHGRGYVQYVLSAMEQHSLETSIRRHGLARYFTRICGLDHIYATDKRSNGGRLAREENLDLSHTWMVGDTRHDFQVAEGLGCHFIFYGGGHQSHTRLGGANGATIEKLGDLLEFLP